MLPEFLQLLFQSIHPHFEHAGRPSHILPIHILVLPGALYVDISPRSWSIPIPSRCYPVDFNTHHYPIHSYCLPDSRSKAGQGEIYYIAASDQLFIIPCQTRCCPLFQPHCVQFKVSFTSGDFDHFFSLRRSIVRHRHSRRRFATSSQTWPERTFDVW